MKHEMSEADLNLLRLTSPIRSSLAKRVLGLIAKHSSDAELLPGVGLHFRDQPLPPTGYFYEPSFAVILQGAKRIKLGDSVFHYDASRFLLTSMNLPTTTEVLGATEDDPYVSVLIKLNLDIAREVLADLELNNYGEICSDSGMATGPATNEMLELVSKTLDLCDYSGNPAYLWGILQREIIYRLLVGPMGARLRQTVLTGTQSNRIAKAINWLKDNFTLPIKVEDLAGKAGMGVSTFHHHFRAMTSMSPLQYQKQLRLHEARRLLLAEQADASTVAFRVGYESSTQFSREYRRQFGQPPIRDMRSIMDMS
ncbi:AraC family transcriptional regulator [Pseudomonas abietaniphila]|uniref:AraC family transcriptional regulator n=1 Tax=Pseudomonas abietaniphila TaxID=89065 RepID=UPI00321680F3